jgi:hypothetical protein
MGRRFHVPFLVDLLTVRDPAEVRELAAEPKLDRGFLSRGPLINRLLSRRIRSVLTVNGLRLPSVAARADERRVREQIELRQRLDTLVPQEVCEHAELAALAYAIQGKLTAEPLEVLAQRVIGKLFTAGYVADATSLRAAKDLYAAASERNPLRYLAWKLTGRIAKAHRILSGKVGDQPAAIHATGVAVFSLVRSLEHMRALWRRPLARSHLSAEQVVQGCIAAPPRILRQAVGSPALGGIKLKPGALVIVKLEEAHRRDRAIGTAFMQEAWSHCPASAFVSVLLAAIWKAALQDRARASNTADAPDLPSARTWDEVYEDGSAEAESVAFEKYARVFLHLQAQATEHSVPPRVSRIAYANQILATDNAELAFVEDLPERLRVGFSQQRKHYKATVRFSRHNGSFGVALRVAVAEGESHDLLLASRPASHARNARQFVGYARVESGTRFQRLLGLARLLWIEGLPEAARILRSTRATRRRTILSLGLESYWSASPIRWGKNLAVRYVLRPLHVPAPAVELISTAPEHLKRELGASLRNGDIAFELGLQTFVDEATTPIEDASATWEESASPIIPVAVLTIFRQDVETAEGQAVQDAVSRLAFNPWHTTELFQPLGNLSRARKAVYAAASAHRLGLRFHTLIPLHNRILGGVARASFRTLNRLVPWHRLSLRLALLNLAMMRDTLRKRNLIDTGSREAPPAPYPVPPPVPEEYRSVRSYDGAFNDLSVPNMGAVGTTFGRNMGAVYRPQLFDTPNAFTVCEQLLKRTQFIPATSINVLAASWIQFQVHDWVNHARHPLGTQDVHVKLPGEVTWRNRVGGAEEGVMRFGDNIAADATSTRQGWPPILFANQVSHWWDASEVYGDGERARSLREKVTSDGLVREGAKLRLTGDGHLPRDLNGMALTGFNESWWLGLSAMHTLFAREHNAVCDALRAEYPQLSDERTYQTARLVVAALIAKIHTIEWTPAILATEILKLGLNTSWHGPGHDALTRFFLWLIEKKALKGIPETVPDHHTAPYSLTEEFVTVYRMHQLMPDDYLLFNHADGRLIEKVGFKSIQGTVTDEVMREKKLENVLYSFGIAHPGAITLHNFPNSLRTFERENGERIDLAVVDLVRTRRRGVPRYNDFRAGLDKPRLRRWEDLTEDPESVRLLKEVYRDIDLVDTVVGLAAETPPEGFGFSDTAFRVFILMASRRLQSDRFLTVDFRPEIYTPLGMDWVARNGMTSIILRHCPQLNGVLPRTGNAFAPWRSLNATSRFPSLVARRNNP